MQRKNCSTRHDSKQRPRQHLTKRYDVKTQLIVSWNLLYGAKRAHTHKHAHEYINTIELMRLRLNAREIVYAYNRLNDPTRFFLSSTTSRNCIACSNFWNKKRKEKKLNRMRAQHFTKLENKNKHTQKESLLLNLEILFTFYFEGFFFFKSWIVFFLFFLSLLRQLLSISL